MARHKLTRDLEATLLSGGREAADEVLNAGTEVEEESRQPGNFGTVVLFRAWHPDTGSGPYRYQTEGTRWDEATR